MVTVGTCLLAGMKHAQGSKGQQPVSPVHPKGPSMGGHNHRPLGHRVNRGLRVGLTAGLRALNTVPSRPPASGRGPRFWRWTPKAVCDSEHVLRQLRPGVKVDLEPFFGTALHWRTCLCQLLQGQPLIELVLLHGCRGIGFLKNWTLPKRRNHEHSCTGGFSSSEETALKGSVTP